jgi:hypothetical protein
MPAKPYDRRQVRRDVHDAGIVSHKLTAHVRRMKKQAARKREAASSTGETGA